MTTFPARVWFQTGNGWASREADKEDKERRAEWISRLNFRIFEKLLANSPKSGGEKKGEGK